MPGVDELLVTYKEKFTNICQEIFNNGLEKHNERVQEVNTFFECVEDAKSENKEIASKRINGFLDYKRKVRKLKHKMITNPNVYNLFQLTYIWFSMFIIYLIGILLHG